MPWLNWSLKLHFRLKTISLLVSTHFTQEYVQRMSYLFVWLYLIKCVFTCSIFVDQHKKIFEYFSYFLKVFCFCKNVKNLKNSVALFWRLSRGLVQLYAPITSPHRDFLRLIGGSMSQSRKILRIFYKILVFFGFSRLSVTTCLRVEGPIVRGIQRCSRFILRLRKIFKFLSLSVLAAGLGDLHVTWLTRENCVFCANWLVFKTFQFSLKLRWLFIVFSISTLSQTHCVTIEKPPFLHHFNLKSSRERYGFPYFR